MHLGNLLGVGIGLALSIGYIKDNSGTRLTGIVSVTIVEVWTKIISLV